MSWDDEFTTDYAPPQEILDAGIPDISWHNNTCPSFGVGDSDHGWVELWVEHPEPGEREGWEHRFAVTAINPAGEQTLAMTGDDVEIALSVYKRLVQEFGLDGPPRSWLDDEALDVIAAILRDPEWAPGMLEDIAEFVKKTGRSLDNPTGEPTWQRH